MSEAARDLLLLEKVEGVVIVRFTEPRLTDMDLIDDVGNQLYKLVDEDAYDRILLNFTGVDHMSSTMLAKLLSLQSKSNKIGGRVALCSISPSLIEVFTITKLDKVLTICRDEEKGLQVLTEQ